MLPGLTLPASLRRLLDAFAGCFTKPSFVVFTAMVVGMIAQTGQEDGLRDARRGRAGPDLVARPGPPVLRHGRVVDRRGRPGRARPGRHPPATGRRGDPPRGRRHRPPPPGQACPRCVVDPRRLGPQPQQARLRPPVGGRRRRGPPAVPDPPGLPARGLPPLEGQGHGLHGGPGLPDDRRDRRPPARAHHPRRGRRRLPRQTDHRAPRAGHLDHPATPQRRPLRPRPGTDRQAGTTPVEGRQARQTRRGRARRWSSRRSRWPATGASRPSRRR